MELLLVRHAIAEERAPKLDDADRQLTPKGIRRFTRVVEGLGQLGLTVDRVLHSPWRRAVQTAELLAPVARGDVAATELLAADPGDDLLALLAEQKQNGRVALVGHQPWLGDLLSLLCFGSPRGGDNIRFKKGGVAWLDGQASAAGMDLVAFLPPKTVRQLIAG
jgi:phosphohistidine phosphatase